MVGRHLGAAVYRNDIYLVLSTMTKRRILIARAIHSDVVAFLKQHFEVHSNDADTVWSPEQLAQQLQGMDGGADNVLRTHQCSDAGRLPAAQSGCQHGSGLQQF